MRGRALPINDFHDWSILAEHTWTIGNNKVNEFRFQYARRALDYTYSDAPGGSSVASNIPGYGFIGREPFSYVQPRRATLGISR